MSRQNHKASPKTNLGIRPCRGLTKGTIYLTNQCVPERIGPAAETGEAGRSDESPFWANQFRLVSLKELLMQPRQPNPYAPDEFHFGPLVNVLYGLGILEPLSPNAVGIFSISLWIEEAIKEMERLGLRASQHHAGQLRRMLQDDNTYSDSHLHDQITMLRTTLMAELDATVFLPVSAADARYYREPARDWEEVIARFPEASDDIKEASRCYALGRYPASIYHCMQALEHGLLALGRFMGVEDPKSGFTAVSNALERVLKARYDDLSDFQKEHRPLFEQLNRPIQAIKDACRNKVDHAQGRAVLLRADFSPSIAMEIYTSTQGFLRRLATELPR